MSHMFHGCSSLKELNLSNFHVDKLINDKAMFIECPLLKGLNLPFFKKMIKKA